MTLLRVRGAAGELAVCDQGDAAAPVVLMAHSILSSHRMWDAQAQRLADHGWRVLRVDTRGHGASDAPSGPATMDDLVDDSIAVLDALGIERMHYVGLSLGGMSGFGLGLRHPQRLSSLVLCDARADAPPAFAAPWDDRIAMARESGCAALAVSTTERWFGKPFLDAQPALAQRLREDIAATSIEGFVACARAIQGLDYLPRLGLIDTPTTLVVGANDGPLPQAMADIQQRMPNATLAIIPDAGHLPNIDQSEAFNAALLRHLQSHRPST